MSDFRKRLNAKRQREARKNLLDNAYEEKLQKMKEIYADLKTNMTKYSSQYESQIRNNKEVRAKFINICNKIGIDPIVSKNIKPLTNHRQEIDVGHAWRLLQPNLNPDFEDLRED